MFVVRILVVFVIVILELILRRYFAYIIIYRVIFYRRSFIDETKYENVKEIRNLIIFFKK